MRKINSYIISKFVGYRLFVTTKVLLLMRRLANIDTIRYHSVWMSPISHSSTIVDLGANKGCFSRSFSKKYDCSVFCVEPNPRLAEYIAGSLSVDVSNIAITDEAGEFDFNISTNSESSSLSSDLSEIWGKTEIVKVVGETFENYLQKKKIDKITLLKIDVEGAEIGILNNLGCDVFKNIDQITVEFHDFLNPMLLPDVENIIKKLDSLGFLCINFDSPKHEDVMFINKNIFANKVYWLDYMLLKIITKVVNLKSQDSLRFHSLIREKLI